MSENPSIPEQHPYKKAIQIAREVIPLKLKRTGKLIVPALLAFTIRSGHVENTQVFTQEPPPITSSAPVSLLEDTDELAHEALSEKETLEETRAVFLDYFEKEYDTNGLKEEVKILNDFYSDKIVYKRIIDAWPSTIPIYRVLNNSSAKSRFIYELLERDLVDQMKYVTPDYGKDVNGDGIMSLTKDNDGNTINEEGKVVNMATFVCDDFSRVFAEKNGLSRDGSHKKGNIKFRLPLLRVLNSEGTNSDYPDRVGKGHGFNAVYFGDNPSEFDKLPNWWFIEPQNDSFPLADPIHYLVENSSMLTLEMPPVQWDETGNTLVTFVQMPDRSIKTMDDTELQIVAKIKNWANMNLFPPLFDGKIRDDLMMDEPDLRAFEREDIEDVASILTQSGYLSRTQVDSALKEAIMPE